ncbi:MAG: hypothetical protein RIR51_1887 [Bacteroidota bacterium]
MNRNDFLRKTCPVITLGILSTVLVNASCVKEEEVLEPNGQNNSGNSTDGITVSGNTVTYDLLNSKFNKLETVGGFYNDTANGVLLLRISSSSYGAYDNCCPHNGSKNSWSFANNKFTCSTHGNSYGIETGGTSSCNSGSLGGNLKNFSVSKSGDSLKVTLA